MKQPPYKEAKEFKQIFGMPFIPYWSIITGFDLIAFDEFMQKGRCYVEDDQTSLSDFISKKYGEPARSLIERLISL